VTLTEFLLARIAEDEEQARTSEPFRLGVWRIGGRVERTIRDHVLAECDAKRRIVEQYADYLSTVKAYRSPRWSDAMNEQDKENARQAEARHRVAEDVARLIALPYADHPDYRQEWKP
jgi:Family of unknown function (DUF6221)